MYLKKTKRKNGRIYLAIVKGYWDKEKKKVRNKTIMPLGYLDDLNKLYPNAVEHFEMIAKKLNETEKVEHILNISKSKTSLINHSDIKNIGYILIKKIYKDLGIDNFFKLKDRKSENRHRLNQAIQLNVFDKCIYPTSNDSAYYNKDSLYEDFGISKNIFMDSYKYISRYKDSLLLTIHNNILKKYNRDTSVLFYTVITYYNPYFENFKSRAINPEVNESSSLVHLGILFDKEGIPIYYKLFNIESSPEESLSSFYGKLKKKYKLDKTIIIADKASSEYNKGINILNGGGYIFSSYLKQEEIEDYYEAMNLGAEDYIKLSNNCKYKSITYPIHTIGKNFRGKLKTIDSTEKLIIYFSEETKRLQRCARNESISQAIKTINNLSNSFSLEFPSSLKYIQGIKIDELTGKLINENIDEQPSLNYKLIQDEEKYDGYHFIVTSEIDQNEAKIIENYNFLFKIKASFAIGQRFLQAKPNEIWTNHTMESHFLTGFLSLIILRIMKMRTGNIFSIEEIVQALREYRVINIGNGIYQCDSYSTEIDAISKYLEIDLSKKYKTSSELKKLFNLS